VKLTVIPAGVTDGSVHKDITIVRDVVKLNSARPRAAIYDVPCRRRDRPHRRHHTAVILRPLRLTTKTAGGGEERTSAPRMSPSSSIGSTPPASRPGA